MIKGNITKSTNGMYTVSIFSEGKRVFKDGPFPYLLTAQECLLLNKQSIKKELGYVVEDRAEDDYKRSYPEFEGRIIRWRNDGWNGGRIVKVKVAGCDYDIGVTFVNPNNAKDYFSCYHGQESPDRKKGKSMITLEQYDKAFKYIIDVIKNDKIYDVQEIYKVYGRSEGFGFGMTSCAFSL